jgi:hypothetical protein
VHGNSLRVQVEKCCSFVLQKGREEGRIRGDLSVAVAGRVVILGRLARIALASCVVTGGLKTRVRRIALLLCERGLLGVARTSLLGGALSVCPLVISGRDGSSNIARSRGSGWDGHGAATPGRGRALGGAAALGRWHALGVEAESGDSLDS